MHATSLSNRGANDGSRLNPEATARVEVAAHEEWRESVFYIEATASQTTATTKREHRRTSRRKKRKKKKSDFVGYSSVTKEEKTPVFIFF